MLIASIEASLMLLGDVMQKFDDEVATLETLLTFEDLSLLADVEAAAARRRLTVGEYTKCAVERFVAQASNGLLLLANWPGLATPRKLFLIVRSGIRS
jgi:hypothetical protein